MDVEVLKRCRICGSENIINVLDLGPQLLASVTLTKENKNKVSKQKVPLELVRCGGKCGLVQLRHSYPSDMIYREYWYRSGINQTMRDALKDVVESALKRVDLMNGDVVVDIGCNDGTLLSHYNSKRVTRIGFDPVENIRGEAESFTRVTDYFNGAKFLNVGCGKKAKIITSIAMFYDLENPNAFVSDIARSLDNDGIWVVQMADLPEMLQKNMFDQIVHEHLEYYHIKPFKYLIENHGLKIVDMEKNSTNGSSYRFYVRKSEGTKSFSDADNRLANYLEQEEKLGLDTSSIYEKFKDNSEKIRDELIKFVRKETAGGKKIIIYGASTKGNVLLQYCGFTEKNIPYAADRNPLKWGGWCNGSNISIISEDVARNMMPDYFLVLPYYFMGEIIHREQKYLEAGGKFIIPIPHVHCVDKTYLRNQNA